MSAQNNLADFFNKISQVANDISQDIGNLPHNSYPAVDSPVNIIELSDTDNSSDASSTINRPRRRRRRKSSSMRSKFAPKSKKYSSADTNASNSASSSANSNISSSANSSASSNISSSAKSNICSSRSTNTNSNKRTSSSTNANSSANNMASGNPHNSANNVASSSSYNNSYNTNNSANNTNSVASSGRRSLFNLTTTELARGAGINSEYLQSFNQVLNGDNNLEDSIVNASVEEGWLQLDINLNTIYLIIGLCLLACLIFWYKSRNTIRRLL